LRVDVDELAVTIKNSENVPRSLEMKLMHAALCTGWLGELQNFSLR